MDKESSKMGEIEILGIVGSQRKHSYNRFALRAMQELVPPGAVLQLIELHGIPYFDARRELMPPLAVLEFRKRVLASDAILFATPECNHSVPGGLKSAIDWAARPAGESAWLGKPAAVISASAGGLRTGRAHHHLRQILDKLRMPTVESREVMNGNAKLSFSPEGELTDEPTKCFIQELLAALVSLVKVNRAAAGSIVREAA
jgi:chromate reductase